MSQRRSAPRAPLSTWVEIASGPTRCRGDAVDLSAGGIGVRASADGLVPGARVVAEFPLPGIGLPLALSSSVVWSDPDRGRVGLAFHDVDPGLRELVESFVAGRLGD